MAVELHLPDLPEVEISLGPPPAAREPYVRVPWHVRWRDTVSAYLPLLLMGVLAVLTGWLVRNTPDPQPQPVAAAPRSDPDYTMQRFTTERFEADGRLKLRVDGEQMHHYPDTDRVEVIGVRIRAFAPDGRITTASAKRALGNGDGSELQLIGDAEVAGQDPQGAPFVIRSEFLHVFLVSERMRTHLPVLMRQGGNEVRAAGLEYDHAAQRLELKGPTRATLPPRAGGTR